MKNKTIPFIFLIGVLLVLGNIFYNPTSTTVVKSNTYVTPANPAFDDDNFYQCVRDNYHRSSSSNNLTDEELASITSLNACGNKNISSVKGIEKLVSLKSAYLVNNHIDEIDISNNTELEEIYISANNLNKIDVSHNSKLERLTIDDIEIIGLNKKFTNVFYEKSLLFNDYDLVFDKNTYDYTLTVGLDTTKLAFCKAYASDNTLCGTLFNFYTVDEKNSYSLMTLLFGTMQGVVTELTINDEEVDVNSLFNYMFGAEESGEDYLLTELKEGDNIIKFNMDNKVYTITIVRKEIIEDTKNTETPVEPKGTEEDTKEVITNNSNNDSNNNTSQNKQFDILKEVPNTGILLSISLSVVSMLLIGLMYYRYYNNKKTNI